MHLHAADLHARQAAGCPVNRQRAVDGNAELAFFFAGRNVVVRVRVHMWIHPQSNWCAPAQPLSDGGKLPEFGFALDIENVNPALQGVLNFRARFANAGENTLARVATRFADAV